GLMTLPKTSLLAGLPASHSASPDSDREWLLRVATSRLSSCDWLTAIAPVGCSGKTFPASAAQATVGTLAPSTGRWENSGMGGPTEAWTLSTSVWPSDASVCSLSHILEGTGEHLQRYYLSARACAGILLRAEKRGKVL